MIIIRSIGIWNACRIQEIAEISNKTFHCIDTSKYRHSNVIVDVLSGTQVGNLSAWVSWRSFVRWSTRSFLSSCHGTIYERVLKWPFVAKYRVKYFTAGDYLYESFAGPLVKIYLQACSTCRGPSEVRRGRGRGGKERKCRGNVSLVLTSVEMEFTAKVRLIPRGR